MTENSDALSKNLKAESKKNELRRCRNVVEKSQSVSKKFDEMDVGLNLTLNTLHYLCAEQVRSQKFTVGHRPRESRSQRRREGWELWRGCPLFNRLGYLGSIVSSPSPGPGGAWRPPTHFWHIWGPQNTSGGENSVKTAGPTSQQSQSFPVKKSTQSTIGGHGPLSPPLATPLVLSYWHISYCRWT